MVFERDALLEFDKLRVRKKIRFRFFSKTLAGENFGAIRLSHKRPFCLTLFNKTYAVEQIFDKNKE